VRLDASWLLVGVLIGWTLGAAVFPAMVPGLGQAEYWAMGAAAAIGLLLSIVAHETAHALVARHFGIPIRSITLFIFGGVAEMEGEPPTPRSELFMAAAGPAASLLLGLLLLLLAPVFEADGGLTAGGGVLSYLGFINLVLAVFNLVPAFPLDGGRMLRAVIWMWRGDLTWATSIAAGAGNMFGILLIVLGVLSMLSGDLVGGMWRVLIGMFVRDAAAASYQQTLAHQLLGDLSVMRVMQTAPITVSPELTVAEFIDDYVYLYHHRWFPVVWRGRVVGAVDTRRAAGLDRAAWHATPVGEIMLPFAPEHAVAPETNLLAALGQMQRGGLARLMVVRGGRLVGILSARDVLAALAVRREMLTGEGAEPFSP
jgi:Zn-dependent protease